VLPTIILPLLLEDRSNDSPGLPNAPSNLVVTAGSSTEIILNWTDNLLSAHFVLDFS
jgi:hypothetical protein